jgi:hypothetical protein
LLAHPLLKEPAVSIERKDIRAKLDAQVHAQLKVICECDAIEMGDYIELVLLPVIARRVHDAIELSARLHGLGISRKTRDSAGKTGIEQE